MKLNFKSTEQQEKEKEKEKDPKTILEEMIKLSRLSLVAAMFLRAAMPAFGLENPAIKPMGPIQPRMPEIKKQLVDENEELINIDEDPFGILAEMKVMAEKLPAEDNRLNEIYKDFEMQRKLMGYGPYRPGLIPAGPDIPTIK